MFLKCFLLQLLFTVKMGEIVAPLCTELIKIILGLSFLILSLLCISTSKRVLCMLFAGRNHFFDTKTSFSVFFPSQSWEKKKAQK